MKQSTRVFFVIAFVIALLTAILNSPALAQIDRSAVAPQARVTEQIKESNLVTLSRNTHPAANYKNDRGAVSDALDLDHILLLLQRTPEQEQALNQLIDELNDRNSPNFHQWLTPEEYGQFGVAQEDINKVVGWLEYHGFRINQVYANHMMIDFSGSAGQVREAFHTDIHQLEVNGEQHLANMTDPQIPVALAPAVTGIVSLNDFKPEPMYRVKPDYTFSGCTSSSTHPTYPGACYAITPQDNATIYNLNPLWSAGYTGTGQTIVTVEDTDVYSTTDFSTYRSTFGLSTPYPSGNLTQVHPGSCTDPGHNADDGEAALDVEVATAVAPNATIELISCPSTNVTFGGLIALENLINAGGSLPGIVSISYGVAEVATGNAGTAAFYTTYQQAAAAGMSVFVSSGDEGSSQGSNNFTAGSEYDLASIGVTGWGETPYNVSVGGTDFEDYYNAKTGQNGGAALSTYWNSSNTSSFGSAKTYVPEIPWNDSCANTLIAEVAKSSFTTYGSTGFCNTSPGNTTAGYLVSGAAGGGPSNCATGAGGSNQSSYLMSVPGCQGWPKPTWQSGTSLSGGVAVYGQPSDGVRDIPDVSMFASNGVWGHYEVVCWSDHEPNLDWSPCLYRRQPKRLVWIWRNFRGHAHHGGHSSPD